MSSLLLVEDHEALADMIANLLRQKGNFQVAGHARSGEDALKLLPHMAVDLVIVDVALPRMNGIDLVAAISKKYPGLPCMMLSAHAEAKYVDLSLAAGARGYVVKDDLAGLFEGVQTVLNGGTYLSQEFIAD
jgi:DNA-binding NarL/FixJ family response regulator